MQQFKPGDKVRIREDLEVGKKYGKSGEGLHGLVMENLNTLLIQINPT